MSRPKGTCVFCGTFGPLYVDESTYDPQRPSVLQWGGCGGRSTAPLRSRAVRGNELNCRSSIIYADFRIDYKLATLPSGVLLEALSNLAYKPSLSVDEEPRHRFLYSVEAVARIRSR